VPFFFDFNFTTKIGRLVALRNKNSVVGSILSVNGEREAENEKFSMRFYYACVICMCFKLVIFNKTRKEKSHSCCNFTGAKNSCFILTIDLKEWKKLK